MQKLKDSLTLRKFEAKSVATQAKRLAAAGEKKYDPYIEDSEINLNIGWLFPNPDLKPLKSLENKN
jgi:hypothetical protein